MRDKDLCDYCVMDKQICHEEMCSEAVIKYIACNPNEVTAEEHAAANKALGDLLS